MDSLLSIFSTSDAKQDAYQGDAHLKQQWLAAWDKSAWSEDLGGENQSNPKLTSNDFPQMDSYSESVQPIRQGSSDVFTADYLPPHVLLGVEKSLQQGLRNPVSSANPVFNVSDAEPVIGEGSRSVITRSNLKNAEQLTDRIVRTATSGNAYSAINFSMSFQGNNVTLWVRDYQEKMKPTLGEHIERIRAQLAEQGLVLAAVMLNGQQWNEHVDSQRLQEVKR